MNEVKEYLKAMCIILKNYHDPTGMNAKTTECIAALLDHCESLEIDMELLKSKPSKIEVLNEHDNPSQG